MKPRARRITIAAAALVAVLVATLVVVCWGTVRDHVEAWHFQLVRETVTIPHPSGCPVILAPDEHEARNMPINVTDDYARIILRHYGYRVLEQRFPRRAYVVIRAARPVEPLWDEEMERRLYWFRRLPPEPPASKPRGALPQANSGFSGTERP